MDFYDYKFIWRNILLTARLAIVVPVTILVAAGDIILNELWDSIK